MQTIEREAPTLDNANAALRNAVEARLKATPADDPKLVGFSPAQNGGCCDGGRCQPKPKATTITVAEQTLQAALDAVRDRHGKYGPPVEHFSRTAALVNAAFGTTFTAADWALVMVLDKVARLRGPTPTTDGGVDIAGYGGCYEECRSRA